MTLNSRYYKNWSKALINKNCTIKKAIQNLNLTALQICFVVEKNKILIGTITDGDIRRALLDKCSIDDKITKYINYKPKKIFEKFTNKELKTLLYKYKMSTIPVVNKNNQIIDAVSWNDLKEQNNDIDSPLIFVVGGKGTRLAPLTNNIPKPMIKINGKPLLEKLIIDAHKQGFMNYTISINYLGDKIKKYFKEGKKFGVMINYIKEKEPLGTAGSLGSINTKNISENFIVANSDIVTNIDYKKLIEFHNLNKADLTLVVKPFFTKHSFSVVESKGIHLKSVSEKPTTQINYGIGIYVLNKKILKKIKKNKFLNMPDLVHQLKENNKFKILTYKMSEDWRDIGRPEDVRSYEVE